MNPTEARLMLTQQYMEALTAGDTEKANQLLWQLNAVSDNAKAPTPSPIPGFPGKSGDIIPPYSGGGTATGSTPGVINLDGPQVTINKPQQVQPKPSKEIKPSLSNSVDDVVARAIKSRDANIAKEILARQKQKEEEELKQRFKTIEEKIKRGDFGTATPSPYSGGRHNIN